MTSKFKNIILLWFVAELVVLVLIAEMIGILPAVLLIILSSIIGSGVLRIQGFESLKTAHNKITKDKAAAQKLLETFATSLGGFLMIIPGFITTIIGILLLIPFLRNKVANYVLSKKAFAKYSSSSDNSANDKESGRVIEGECQHED